MDGDDDRDGVLARMEMEEVELHKRRLAEVVVLSLMTYLELEVGGRCKEGFHGYAVTATGFEDNRNDNDGETRSAARPNVEIIDLKARREDAQTKLTANGFDREEGSGNGVVNDGGGMLVFFKGAAERGGEGNGDSGGGELTIRFGFYDGDGADGKGWVEKFAMVGSGLCGEKIRCGEEEDGFKYKTVNLTARGWAQDSLICALMAPLVRILPIYYPGISRPLPIAPVAE